MIVTPQIAIRIAVIVIGAVLLELSFFSQVELFHTSPTVLPAVVCCLGLLGGSLTGAVTGFAAGLLLDCLLIAPLGASSIVLLSAGYLAGLYRERFELSNRYTAPLLCMALTLYAQTVYAAMQLMLGVDAPISGLVVRDMLIKTVYAFLLGFPVFALIRLLLRPALVDERFSGGDGGGRRLRIRGTRLGRRVRRAVAA